MNHILSDVKYAFVLSCQIYFISFIPLSAHIFESHSWKILFSGIFNYW